MSQQDTVLPQRVNLAHPGQPVDQSRGVARARHLKDRAPARVLSRELRHRRNDPRKPVVLQQDFAATLLRPAGMGHRTLEKSVGQPRERPRWVARTGLWRDMDSNVHAVIVCCPARRRPVDPAPGVPRMRTTPTLLALAVASLCSTLAGTSLAQTAGTASPSAAAPANETAEARAQRLAREQAEAQRQSAPAAERIVVTGARRSQSASTVPFNISAINGEQLRQENVTDLKSLISELPAVNAPGNSARFADSVTVRGLSIAPVNANNIEQFVRSTIAYYVDETPLPNVGLRIKDIARVETLLGPQGTLYGAGSLGGTIRYISNQPVLRQFEGRVGASLYQSSGGGLSNDLDAVVNVPLGNQFVLRASVARLDEAGTTDRVSSPPWRGNAAWSSKPNAGQNVYKDDDWQEVTTARAALLWQVTPGVKLTLTHTQQDQLAHGTRGVSVQPLGVANARSPAELDAAWRNPGRTLAQLPCAPSCRFTDARETPFAVNANTVLARYP
jgi:hypothetical protein